jgi:hypothetical protein
MSFVVRTSNYVIDFSNILHGVGGGGVLTSLVVSTSNYVTDSFNIPTMLLSSL